MNAELIAPDKPLRVVIGAAASVWSLLRVPSAHRLRRAGTWCGAEKRIGSCTSVQTIYTVF